MAVESDPSLPQDLIRDLVARLPLETADKDSEQIIYRGRNLLLRCHLADGRPVVVKQWRGRGPGSGKVLRKARASFAHAGALRQLGIRTPQPYLWWGRGGWWSAEAAYVCAEVSEAVQIRVLHGEQWITQHPGIAQQARQQRHDHLQAVGELAARMHQAGWLHRDFTAGNILLACEDAGWAYHLVDLNRCAQYRQLSWQQGVANLVQLEFQDPHDRDTLLSAYGQGRGCSLADCQAWYERCLKRHLRRFAWKNATRKWRHPLRHRG